MFSESRAPAPGEQRGFKPHGPHFIPWLRNSLKPQHAGGGGGGGVGGGGGDDLGLNGPYKSAGKAEANRNSSLAPLEKSRGIGIFSSNPAKSRGKKELRFNAAGVARILPVVLRGHHILPGVLGKHREEGGSGERPPGLDPEPEGREVEPQQQEPSNSSASVQDQSPQGVLQSDGTATLLRRYGPPAGAPPSEPDRKVSAGGPEDAAPGWLSSDTSRDLTERRHVFTSSFTLIQPKSSSSQSHRDLTALRELPAECPGRPLNGLIFSTEVPLRGLAGCSTSLRSSRKHRLSLDHSGTLGAHSHTWTQRRPTNESREPARKEAGAGCSRKVVRHQIKRVVDNLEQVLRALRDVHQEMSEVVQQIEFLTSTIDLDEDEPQQSATGGGRSSEPAGDGRGSRSAPGEATTRRCRPRPAECEDKPAVPDSCSPLIINQHGGGRSPPAVLLSTVTSGFLTDRKRSPRFTSALQSDWPQQQHNDPQSPPRNDPPPSSLRELPVRPPTPGLSPLTVNFHHPSSPASPPHSPSPSASSSSPSSTSSIKVSPPSPLRPKPQARPTLCPSVIIENKTRTRQPPESGQPCPPLTAARTPSSSDGDPASFAGPISKLGPTVSNARPPVSQDRQGRKPPPYPHQGASELTKKAKEPRKAPPYPEKRRLLSTTV
ncbi:uncharacterized protein LOC142885989 [Nelusetta ayraudi]|uniref:uncharacterized protein LOC142885989 n=1 Tax=Nelusetta ayraudi TaxID=303726 RepID=UPI003F726ECF